MSASQTPYEATLTNAGQAAVDAVTRVARLEEGNGPAVDLYHVLNALLHWADARKVDFDEALSSIRADLAGELAPSILNREPVTAAQLGFDIIEPADRERFDIIEPADRERFDIIRRNLINANPPSFVVASKEAAEREARRDQFVAQGHIIGVRDITGYKGEADQVDLRTEGDAPPFAVIVRANTAGDHLNWSSAEDLDPYWNIEPAPGETRLEGLRSLWTFGVSYRVEA